MNRLLIILILLTLSSCNMYKGIDVINIENGMTVKDVQNIVIIPMSKVSMSTDEDGKFIEVYIVQKRIVRGGIARQEKYQFVFKNNKLVEYEKVSEN